MTTTTTSDSSSSNRMERKIRCFGVLEEKCSMMIFSL